MKPNLSRRQFLAHSAGLAGASLGIGRPLGARGGAGQESRIGFIGLGDRGKYLLDALLSLDGDPVAPRFRVTALCDVYPRHLRRGLDRVGQQGVSENRPRGYASYRALLDDPNVDAVVLATPVHLHAEQTVTALAAGKHVYCEKPLAHTVEDCEKVAHAARAAAGQGRLLQVGLQRRYSLRYRRAMACVHSGEAGSVRFVRAQWHAAGQPPRDKPWLFEREKSGGMVLEQACHQFDLFNWLLGSTPLQVCGLGGTLQGRRSSLHSQPQVMDHYGVVLEYPGGVHTQLSHLSFAIPDRRFAGIYELVFAEKLGLDLANAIAWNEAGITRQLLPLDEEGTRRNDTQLALQGFLEALAQGRAPDAGLQAGLDSTLTALMCQRALETGRTVSWEELATA